MRRADRLFEIIQFMRRKDLVRARDLSDALEVSERTIYRDIQDLITSGVPIEGEAGVGYVLKAGFDLPPLMFKEQEIEALVLGARIVQSWADPELAAAATDVIAKVEAVIPDRLRSYMANTALLAPSHHYMETISFDVADLRRALRSQLKVLRYAMRLPNPPSAPCGRCAWRISARAALGLVRCATTSAPSVSTASMASPCRPIASDSRPARPCPISSSAIRPGRVATGPLPTRERKRVDLTTCNRAQHTRHIEATVVPANRGGGGTRRAMYRGGQSALEEPLPPHRHEFLHPSGSLSLSRLGCRGGRADALRVALLRR